MDLVTSSPALAAFAVLAIVVGGVAVVNRPTPAPIIAVGGETALPTVTVPTAAPTEPPPTEPPPTAPPAIEPAQLRALQLSAAKTLRNLADFAATGNVAAVEPLLGDTAPGLQASGLRRAIFPAVAAAAILVERDGAGFVATAGGERLTTTDGVSWTFDYGDRPLAAFGQAAERDLYWIEPNGRHDLFLRVTGATVSTSRVLVRFAWTYNTSRPQDPYYRDATIAITAITLGSQPYPLSTPPSGTIDPAVRSAVLALNAEVDVPSQIFVQVTITPRRGAGGSTTVRSVSTLFELHPL
jgi:hypothetical protein